MTASGRKQPLECPRFLSSECPLLAESSRSETLDSKDLNVRYWETRTLRI
jgi:hypothetical protein